MKKGSIKTILFYLILIAVVIAAVSVMFSKGNTEKVTYGDVIDYFQEDRVIEFTVNNKYFLTLVVDELDEEGKPLGNTTTVG